jgi:hypothetical protein
MSERLNRRVGALEARAWTASMAPIEVIHSIWKPGAKGPIWLYDLASDGTTILRKNERPAASTEGEVRRLYHE